MRMKMNSTNWSKFDELFEDDYERFCLAFAEFDNKSYRLDNPYGTLDFDFRGVVDYCDLNGFGNLSLGMSIGKAKKMLKVTGKYNTFDKSMNHPDYIAKIVFYDEVHNFSSNKDFSNKMKSVKGTILKYIGKHASTAIKALRDHKLYSASKVFKGIADYHIESLLGYDNNYSPAIKDFNLYIDEHGNIMVIPVKPCDICGTFHK